MTSREWECIGPTHYWLIRTNTLSANCFLSFILFHLLYMIGYNFSLIVINLQKNFVKSAVMGAKKKEESDGGNLEARLQCRTPNKNYPRSSKAAAPVILAPDIIFMCEDKTTVGTVSSLELVYLQENCSGLRHTHIILPTNWSSFSKCPSKAELCNMKVIYTLTGDFLETRMKFWDAENCVLLVWYLWNVCHWLLIFLVRISIKAWHLEDCRSLWRSPAAYLTCCFPYKSSVILRWWQLLASAACSFATWENGCFYSPSCVDTPQRCRAKPICRAQSQKTSKCSSMNHWMVQTGDPFSGFAAHFSLFGLDLESFFALLCWRLKIEFEGLL